MHFIFPCEKMYIPTLTQINKGEMGFEVSLGRLLLLRLHFAESKAGDHISGMETLPALWEHTSGQRDRGTQDTTSLEMGLPGVENIGQDTTGSIPASCSLYRAWPGCKGVQKSTSEGEPGFPIQSSIYHNYILYYKVLK